jgi:ComF family protein
MGKMLKTIYSNMPFKIDYLVPVPLSKERMNSRGFNQSEILAKEINWRYKNLLIKTKNTIPQARSKRAQRLTNLENAFEVCSKYDIRNKNIVLIDDVCTSGSTLMECAKVLKLAGASKVIAIVWAKD